MNEYQYDELSMALGFAFFGARMAANRPTPESYRRDSAYSDIEPKRLSNRTLPTKGSFHQGHRNERGVSFETNDAFDIPVEDITEYTEEEIQLFEKFTKKNSAYMDFDGVYEEGGAPYGENYDIPTGDGPTYSEEEIRKFELFQKAKSASVRFDGVYEDDDDETYGENYNVSARGGPAYPEDEIIKFDLFQKVKSAKIQFQFDGVDEKEDLFFSGHQAAAGRSEVYTEQERRQLEELAPASGEFQQFDDEEEYIHFETVAGLDPSIKATKSSKPSAEQGPGADAAGKGSVKEPAADADATVAIAAAAETSKFTESEGNEVDSTLSPQCRQAGGSRPVLTPIPEATEGEEYSPAPTPVLLEAAEA